MQCLPVVTHGNCRGPWSSTGPPKVQRAGPPVREDNTEDRDSVLPQYIQGFHDDEEEILTPDQIRRTRQNKMEGLWRFSHQRLLFLLGHLRVDVNQPIISGSSGTTAVQ